MLLPKSSGVQQCGKYLPAQLVRAALLLSCAPLMFANSASTTQTMNLNLNPAGKVQVVTSTVNLTHTGSIFNDFAGSESLNFKVRTTISTGSATLTAKASAEFSPTTGPLVANGDLTYTCTGSNFTACSGPQTVSTTTAKTVVSAGAGVCVGTGCAAPDPSSVTVNMLLTDNPAYKTGSYSTTITFTFSLL